MKSALVLSLATLLTGAVSAQLINGGFETGDLTGWNQADLAFVAPGFVNSGDFAAVLPVSGTQLISQTLAANPGEIWDFSGFAAAPHPLNGGDVALLKIVWRDAGDFDLPPLDILVGSADFPAFPGIRSDLILDAGNTPSLWSQMNARGVAPVGTTSVTFFAITVQVGGDGREAVYFDDLTISRLVIPEPAFASLAGWLLVGGFLASRRRRLR